MSVVRTSATEPAPASSDSLHPRHVHLWELRAVEFDTWGQVSYYECLGCPQVRYL